MAEAENGVNSFDEALEAIKENGQLISNLNAKADGCFFGWKSKTNQISLVDSKNNYEVLFSLEEYEPMGKTWHFAISNKEVADKVETDLGKDKITIMNTISNLSDLKDAIEAGGEFYIDESVVLDKENLLTFNNDDTSKTSIVNLGTSYLNTTGILSEDGTGIIPVEVKKSKVIFNGGVISTGGENLNYH